ncbi:MAG: ISAs1 family transposase [Ferruginibacter sp.]|nr:ISAs1 family transposase [Cytophagales bacterium]
MKQSPQATSVVEAQPLYGQSIQTASQLEALLTSWGKHLVGILAEKQLIVDGKQLRGTLEAGRKQASVQIVSLWAEAERLCLAQRQIASKTNEIKAIPELIVDKKADYIIGLKANQDELYQQVVHHFERRKACLSGQVSPHLEHGRAEKGLVVVSEKLSLLDAAEGWMNLRSVVCVASSRWQNGQQQDVKCYYISWLAACSPARMGVYIRRHWSIENEQHWHLDVTFDEDGCQVRRDHAPRNLSTIRKLALGLITRQPTKMSVKRKKAARDDAYLRTL